MIITITAKDIHDERITVMVDNRNDLVAILSMFNSNENISQIKVETPGHVVTSLYTEFGIGEISKFVTQFTYNQGN